MSLQSLFLWKIFLLTKRILGWKVSSLSYIAPLSFELHYFWQDSLPLYIMCQSSLTTFKILLLSWDWSIDHDVLCCLFLYVLCTHGSVRFSGLWVSVYIKCGQYFGHYFFKNFFFPLCPFKSWITHTLGHLKLSFSLLMMYLFIYLKLSFSLCVLFLIGYIVLFQITNLFFFKI